MKPADVRAKNEADLEKMINDLQDELFILRVKKVTGQLEKTANLRTLRRDLARAKTVLRERSLGK
ncbi:MAG: 50S ribosomal protein L29 [Deltaproteobacteria bacterium CG11_big_fil_rev_8_21_14_0_20_47_16]|nr:MAG: 50S ribosomal protein L29 [Deltaproteobacteria bacterium CG11_big_fil_rev_8_21_14_0_20_47_16]